MASRDQIFQAGEAKGQAQEKANQMADGIKDKAQSAVDKVSETAQAAKDKTAGSKDQSGGFVGTIKERGLETTEFVKQKAAEAGQAAQVGKEKTGGILQQTADAVVSTAQSAAETVKSGLGMGTTTTTKD